MSGQQVSSADRPVLCFGESLWDVFGDTSRPGGAPLNVAVHLRRLGRRAIPVTAVGADPAGDRLRALISQERLPLAGITRSDGLPTGRVDVTLDADGEPDYTIREPAAWDAIELSSSVLEESARASALVFGTLAQRTEHNRDVLDGLLERLPDDALRVLDVNFREPFVDLERTRELAGRVDLLKVSRDELARLCTGDDVETMIDGLATQLGTGVAIVVTLGADGAALFRDGHLHRAAAESIEVVDAVGAGDAFLAALVDGLLDRRNVDDVLARASRVAAQVAAKHGAW